MRDLLLEILNDYNENKKVEFEKNILAKKIRKAAPAAVFKIVNIDESNYKVEGSPGKGNWADVPWIAIFDKDITKTATKGYDIVYLFCADMSGVYISLNQGWTYFQKKYGAKSGREKIVKVSEAWKKCLNSTLSDFSFDKIDLKNENNKSTLAKGYELGHICGKYYSLNNMPSNKVLASDLQKLLGVYRELKGNLRDGSIEKTNDYLIVNSSIDSFDSGENVEGIESSIENFEKYKLQVNEIPDNFKSKGKKKFSFKGRKTDFIQKAKNQKNLGLMGELMVLKHEIDYLKENGKSDYVKDVRHVSKEDGDGLGYDILSKNLDGSEKFIEVKTTTGNETTAFMISDNELEFSKRNASKYYLYRVYNFKQKEENGESFILKGDMNKVLSLSCITYSVDGLI